MVTKKHGVFIETRGERRAEPGPSVVWLVVLLAALAVSLLGLVWQMFFQA